jgi:hypothetical protein
MLIFVVLTNGSRIAIEIEETDLVSTLKELLSQYIHTTQLLPLTFNSQALEDNRSLASYNIKRDSVVNVQVKQKGYSLRDEDMRKHTDTETYNRGTNWERDRQNPQFTNFRPITDKALIPFYDEVTNQPYHNGLNQEDKEYIVRYTGNDEYKRLKVQAYTLDPDEDQLKFLKKLYLACWSAVQSNLPEKVYHICYLTEQSFGWLRDDLVFYTPGFVSTTTKKDFRWDGNCKWEITLTKGKRHHAANISSISQNPTEDEILLSCCTRFRVTSTRTNHDGFAYYVYLDYLDL